MAKTSDCKLLPQVQIGFLASNSNEVKKREDEMKTFPETCIFSVVLLRVQVLRLNGLTLAALGQTQAS